MDIYLVSLLLTWNVYTPNGGGGISYTSLAYTELIPTAQLTTILFSVPSRLFVIQK